MKVYVLVKYDEIVNEPEILEVYMSEVAADLKAHNLNKGTLTWPYYVLEREVVE